MLQTKTIVILANSVRSGHRCVAGKEIFPDGDSWTVGKWIRLSDPGTKDGSIRHELTKCRGGEIIEPLDVVEIPIDRPAEDPDHPEDWFVDCSLRWSKVSRLPVEQLSLLVDEPRDLWRAGGDGRSVPEGYLRKMGEPATLFLISNPLNAKVSWWKERGVNADSDGTTERVRTRLTCTYGGAGHIFAVTDSRFTEKYHLMDRAEPREQTIRLEGDIFMCASLTRPWKGYQYKVAATIFEADAIA